MVATELNLILMELGPVLEALGSAKTSLNDTSSRFSRYVELFIQNNEIKGGLVRTYLLEKSRVVSSASDESNFHIFYLLLYGSSDEMRMNLKLKQVEDYQYLKNRQARETSVYESEFVLLDKALHKLFSYHFID